MIDVSNVDFLKCIFGENYIYAHVTSFIYDPDNLPPDKRGIAWAGGYYKDTPLIPNSNQFYTVSLFVPSEKGRSFRRGATFSATWVVGLDDVREKLSITEVEKLPPPTIVLKSSLHSEQWLYVLDTPETNRDRIDNLHDGLIASGLAPDCKDPGQKGVTRYLRLPEGCNTKQKRVDENGGTAPKCQVTIFEPSRRYALEQLATPFNVDLDATRVSKRVDGATDISDHPLLQIPDIIHLKSAISPGRWDCTCPWVDEHTGADDSGSAIFTNEDGSLGFKCHHGNCQDKTGGDLLRKIEIEKPGFRSEYAGWQADRMFKDLMIPKPPTTVSFDAPPVSFFEAPAPATPIVEESGLQAALGKLMAMSPRSPEIREATGTLLKLVDTLPAMERKIYHDDIRSRNLWSKPEFKEILKDLRQTWYLDSTSTADFYDNAIYVKELNQFYDYKSRIFFTAEAFQNSYSHEDAEARKIALQDGRVRKVDRLDFAPKQPRVFVERGTTFGNTWSEGEVAEGIEGDVTPWLNHWNKLGWTEYRTHMLQWMAYTLRYPEHKINHMLILGSGEGCGKDFLLTPLLKAMDHNAQVISGDELLSQFNDFILSTKFLLINEVDTGNRAEALSISNSIKPYAAAPPETLRVNRKNVNQIQVRNIVNSVMTTNSRLPLRINGVSRRIYAMWSGISIRDGNDNVKPEWLLYWEDQWNWMRNGGAEACIWYLRNKVDLSNFNPFAAPPMTDFLREITDESKSPIQRTIETFIDLKLGAFAADLLSREDAVMTLKAGEAFYPQHMFCDTKAFTPGNIGRVMSEMNTVVHLRARRNGSERRLWAVRDVDVYVQMPSCEVYDVYEEQRQKVNGEQEMRIVK